MVIKCPHCGFDFGAYSKYCPNCGNLLESPQLREFTIKSMQGLEKIEKK